MGHCLPATRIWDDLLSREKTFSRGPECVDVSALRGLELALWTSSVQGLHLGAHKGNPGCTCWHFSPGANFRNGFSLISLLSIERSPGGALEVPLWVLTEASMATCFPRPSGLE